MSTAVTDAERLERAFHALQRLQAKLAQVEAEKSEPLAVVGMACRFPGDCSTPAAYWDLLRSGRHGVSPVPRERWDIDAFYDPAPDALGKMSTRFAGFIGEVRDFDADFFGVAPREAESLDPQHRLAMEVAWEALEDAGQANARLTGSRTGVYLGICSSDYSFHLLERGAEGIDAYMATGNAHSTAAGRLSFCLGLQGPSLAVDTACSSSLVSVHLACRALRSRECDMALVGGVNLILAPEYSINFSKARMLAPDGFCKAFDASADGFGRAEGCGFIVLKRLSDAQAAGDVILAVVRGSAINHDGRSSGLTVPNGPAQQAVIRAALSDAGLEPDAVGYIEAHGTGTTLGDPIEMGALRAVFGKRPAAQPLVVASAKTNLGHLEAAAGIAGIIKVVLSLQHRELPPHLHFKQPSPHIAWEGFPVEIPTTTRAWSDGVSRIGGVSSFGFSGTNAHVILEQAPAPKAARQLEGDDRPTHVLALAAKSDAALNELAQRYLALDSEGASVADTCFSANTGRSPLPYRLCVTASSLTELKEKLGSASLANKPKGIARGFAENRPKVAFLFTGQGAQYPKMGRRLYETQPVFRRTLDRCSEIVSPLLEQDLLSVMFADGTDAKLNETSFTQPALFALEYALAELWKSWGIKPNAVMGHSVGEYVAACVAGVFGLEDGLRLIAARARLMQALPRNGSMVAVLASEQQLRALIEPYAADVSIAAINGPRSVVLSGLTTTLQRIAATLEVQGIKSKQLAVSHAFHSPLMLPMLEQFAAEVAGVKLSRPTIPLISNLSGARAGSEITNVQYWVDHVRQPVRFSDAVLAADTEGCRTFLEIGPQPTLVAMAQLCLVGVGPRTWLPSLRRGGDDWSDLLESLSALCVQGVAVDWDAFDAAYPRARVKVPHYPFQRTRYWMDRSAVKGSAQQVASVAPTVGTLKTDPVLGVRAPQVACRPGEHHWERRLGTDEAKTLGSYLVGGQVVLPMSTFSQIALSAAAQAFESPRCSISEINVREPLFVSGPGCDLQFSVVLESAGRAQFQAYGRPSGQERAPWKLHATASLRRQVTGEA
jgi:acyl transferase domain-containing protein